MRTVAVRTVAALFSALFLAELAVRFLLPQFALPRRLTEHFVLDRLLDSRMRASSLLGYEWRSTVEKPLDDLGFQTDHSYRLPKKKQETRLVVLGDSVAEALMDGSGLRQLELELSAALRRTAKLWGFGVMAYSLVQYEAVLRHRAPPIRPDEVLVLFCLNDVDPSAIPVLIEIGGRLWEVHGARPEEPEFMSRRLFGVSQLYRTLWFLWRSRMRPSFRDRRAPEDMFASLVDWCREHGVGMTGVIFPLFKPLEQYSPDERNAYATLEGWLRKYGVPFLDLHAKFDLSGERWKSYRDPARPRDDIHPNSEGNQEAIRHIAAFFADRAGTKADLGRLPRGSPP